MPASDPPFDERRHDDRLADWRMKRLEEQVEALTGKFNDIQVEVTQSFAKLDQGMAERFADLRKELFEKPVFVTVQWMALELNHRDAKLAELNKTIETRASDSVSSRRFNITTAITFISVAIALAAVLWRQ